MKLSLWFKWEMLGTFLVLCAGCSPLFYNTSDSIPAGWYVMDATDTLMRGDIVRLCLPPQLGRRAVRKDYVHRGSCPGGSRRIGKPVVAVAGDTVIVAEDSIQINHEPPIYAPIQFQDRRGRVMIRTTERAVLNSGECFLLSSHSQFSFDSRYFGPVPCNPPYQVLNPVR